MENDTESFNNSNWHITPAVSNMCKHRVMHPEAITEDFVKLSDYIPFHLAGVQG